MLGRDQQRVSVVTAPHERQQVPEWLANVDDIAVAVTTQGRLQMVTIGPMSDQDLEALTGMIAR